ncbi:MAG TPA: S41 family peptidase [Azospirillaceae bacterium]|nr:S41 family peptidase [Azospirillaceae bacterium]
MPRPALLAAVLTAGLLSGTVQASPASDFYAAFEEALLGHYVSLHGADPVAVARTHREKLAEACRAGPGDCPVETAVTAVRAAVKDLNDAHVRLDAPRAGARPLANPGAPGNVPPGYGWALAHRQGAGLHVLAAVNPGGPAARAGLARGDILRAVDGNPDVAAALDRLRAADGPVTVEVERAGRRIAATVAPAPGEGAPRPTLAWAGRTAVIHLPSCMNVEAGGQFRDAVAEAAAKGAAAIVMDLRDNRGGGFACAIAAGAFIDYDIVMTAKDGATRTLRVRRDHSSMEADGEVETVPAGNPVRWDGPAAVLVNGLTASAAEAAAIEMKLTGRARVYGETTRGVGNNTVRPFPLPGGHTLFLSVTRHATPEGVPLPPSAQPDLPVTDDPVAGAAGRDAVLEAALEGLGRS